MEADKIFLNGFIEKYVNKNRKLYTITGIVLLVIGLAILALFIKDGLSKEIGDTIGLLIVFIFFFLLGLYFLIYSFRTRVEKNEVYNSINGDTNDVVWIYDSVTNRSGRSFYEVNIGMKTGKTIKFTCADQQNQVVVRNHFRNICTNAKIGYSSERELGFKKNPTNFQ